MVPSAEKAELFALKQVVLWPRTKLLIFKLITDLLLE